MTNEEKTTDGEIEHAPAVALYATGQKFNGQALSQGRVVLVCIQAPQEEPEVLPYMVDKIDGDRFYCKDGPGVALKAFVAEPSTSKRGDGQVMVHLVEGQWTWPPRV
jgi:hypothetical protein